MDHNNNPFLITPDLSEAVELNGAPPGVYNCRVVALELKAAKTGGQYIKWGLSIFGAEGDLAKFNNWKVYYNTMLSGKGAGMLKSFVKACTGKELPQGTFDFSTLQGSEVLITLAQGRNQDGSPSQYPEVKKVQPLPVPF